jgi:hypothetical protein
VRRSAEHLELAVSMPRHRDAIWILLRLQRSFLKVVEEARKGGRKGLHVTEHASDFLSKRSLGNSMSWTGPARFSTCDFSVSPCRPLLSAGVDCQNEFDGGRKSLERSSGKLRHLYVFTALLIPPFISAPPLHPGSLMPPLHLSAKSQLSG